MEQLEIPEIYRKPTLNCNNTMTEERAEFDGLPCKSAPDCSKCDGAGFLHPIRQQDGTVDYSRVIPCDSPGCYRDQAIRHKMGLLISSSGVVGLKQNFESFNAEVPGVRKAYRAAWKIAEGDKDFIWLLIFGGVGSGKSHLLNAIANRAMERRVPTRLVMMAELLSELRMAMATNETDFKLRELKEIPYLLIDELGLEYGTEWEKEKIEELLASRWANGRFTVVATNRDIEELPPRIKSRFLDRHLSRAILNEAGDFRLMKTRRAK